MQVLDAMTHGVLTVPLTMPAWAAWELMRSAGIRHVVVTHDHKVAGVMSTRDAGGRAGGNLRAGKTVSDLMTHEVETASPTDDLMDVAHLMCERHIGCVPVRAGSR